MKTMQSFTDENGKKWYLYLIHINDCNETIELAHEKQWSLHEFGTIVQKRKKFLQDAREEYDMAIRSLPRNPTTDELEAMPVETRNVALAQRFENDKQRRVLLSEFQNKIGSFQDCRKFLELEGFVELDSTFFII